MQREGEREGETERERVREREREIFLIFENYFIVTFLNLQWLFLFFFFLKLH